MSWDLIVKQGLPLALACVAIVYLWNALQAERRDHINNLLRILEGDEDSNTKPKSSS